MSAVEPEEPHRDPGQEPEDQAITKAELRWIFGGIIAIIFGIFIAQNAKIVEVQFVFFTARVRLIWVFLICAVLGAIIDRLLQRRGVLPTTPRRRRREVKKPPQ
jgi:uncharacterized integral membrane protein